jgi:hypothetical protein
MSNPDPFERHPVMSQPSPANDFTSSLPASLNEDLYTLHEQRPRARQAQHWWTCTVCGTKSGSYSTKRAARNSAERHAEDYH